MGRRLIGVPRVQGLAVTEPREPDEDDEAGSRAELADDGLASDEEDVTIRKTGESPDWVDKIKDAIPIEVVTAWIAIHAYLMAVNGGPNATYWVAFAVVLVATGLHMWTDIELPEADQDTWRELVTWKKQFAVGAHVGLAMGAFVVWALYLLASGTGAVELPWLDVTLREQHATVLLVLYTLVGPQLVPELITKVLGVEVETVEESVERPST